jgi:hypothetical protein
MQQTAFGARDRCYFSVIFLPRASAAADAQGVGRARANHVIGGQRMIQPRDCCGPTANAYDRASARHHGQRIPCLDRPSPGTPANAITGHASGRHRGGNGIAGNALGRCRGPRIRPSSRPTALKRNASERHPRPRPRAPTWLAGDHAPPAWCRPTSACSPTPLRGPRSFRF